jgi:hypothetical protein
VLADLVGSAVDRYAAGFADVDDTEFSTLAEKICLERIVGDDARATPEAQASDSRSSSTSPRRWEAP